MQNIHCLKIDAGAQAEVWKRLKWVVGFIKYIKIYSAKTFSAMLLLLLLFFFYILELKFVAWGQLNVLLWSTTACEQNRIHVQAYNLILAIKPVLTEHWTYVFSSFLYSVYRTNCAYACTV